jgi:hypothetical protein
MSLDKQTVEETEEKRDHDEQHQRGQIAEDQDQHEPPLDTARRVETPCALRCTEAVAVIANHDERPEPEVAGTFEIAGHGGESVETKRIGLTGERRKERGSERVRASRGHDGVVDQPAADTPLSDRNECALDRAAARDEGFRPLDKCDERAFRVGSPPRGSAVDTKRREEEATVRGGDHDDRPDRSDHAHDRSERGSGKSRNDLRAHEIAFSPPEAALREISRHEEGADYPRRVGARRELREALPDGGSRTDRENRGDESCRGENGSDDDQRRPPSTARRLAITPITSRVTATGIRTNRPSG